MRDVPVPDVKVGDVLDYCYPYEDNNGNSMMLAYVGPVLEIDEQPANGTRTFYFDHGPADDLANVTKAAFEKAIVFDDVAEGERWLDDQGVDWEHVEEYEARRAV